MFNAKAMYEAEEKKMKEPTKTTNLKRVAPGRVSCKVIGCEIPQGQRGEGFTEMGLNLHMIRMHEQPVKSKTAPLHPVQGAAGQAVRDAMAASEVDMGPATRLIDDIKAVVSAPPATISEETKAAALFPPVTQVQSPLHDQIKNILGWHNGVPTTWQARERQIDAIIALVQAPVVPSPNGAREGILVRAVGGKLSVLLDDHWQEMTLEQFINNIRFAVSIS